jgi:uncharacterized protein YhbP (UPF0306 family)
MDLKELISEFLTSTKIMQLATVDGDQPWLCTVHFSSDDSFNLFWVSQNTRQHSKELVAHPKVAATIVKDPERKQALQITGEAHEVTGDDLVKANAIYGKRFGSSPELLAKAQTGGPDAPAYYILKPTLIALWDEVNFPDNPKQEYRLS